MCIEPHSIFPEVCKTITAAIVGSRLGYCNSLLAGLSVSNLAHLQLVQKTLARVSTEKSCFCHITPILSDLHWLPVRHRINFKIATITFKVLQFQQPSYLATLIPRYVPTRSVRSSSLSLCVLNRKTGMDVHIIFICCLFGINSQVIFHQFPLFPLSGRHSCTIFFQSAFPRNLSPSTGIMFFYVSPSTNATQVRHTPPPG